VNTKDYENIKLAASSVMEEEAATENDISDGSRSN